jgi:aspartate racemase
VRVELHRGSMPEPTQSVLEPATEATLGIIGGAGPGASARLYLDVAARLRAATGRLPQIVLWNLPLTDEIERSLVGGEPDGDAAMAATRLVAQGVERLLAAGATVIAMPCNSLAQTAARESERRGVPFVDMIAATLDAVRASGHRAAVLLATEATYAGGFYEGPDVEILAPPPVVRQELAALIQRGVGGALSAAELRDLVERARRPGACVVLGCTDICGLLDAEAAAEAAVVESLACLVASCAERLGVEAPADASTEAAVRLRSGARR